MATLTSQLVVELLDRVTAPARSVSRSLLGISDAARNASGQPVAFGNRLNDAMTRTNQSLDVARGRMVDAVAGFYGLRAAIAAPVQEAIKFESAMADVKKVVDFPTPQAFLDFQKALMDMSRDIPLSVTALGEIAAAAGQAGIAGADLIRFTESAAKIGVAFDISADQAGEAMAKMMTGLGMTIDETVSLTDAMNHLSNAQASSAAEILDVVRRVGAQGKMFGFTAEQTAAFGSAMIASGAQSDVAATSFNNMGRALTRGAAATKGQSAAYAALGMDAEQVSKDMQKNAVETTVAVLEQIAKLPKEQQASISSQLFGDEARALGPLLTNLDLVRTSLGLVADEANYAGSAFKEFEARNKTFGSQLQRFNNLLTNLKIVIGNALLPALSGLIEAITPVIDRLTEFMSAHPQITSAVLASAAAVVAFKVAVAALTFAGLLGRAGALSMLSVGFNTIGRAAIGAKNAASSMIALQTALGAMSGQSLGTLGTIGAGLRGIILAVPGVGLLSSAITGIGAAIATISAPVWGTFAVVAAAVAAAGITIYKYWDRITAVLSGVGQAIGTALQPAMQWLGDKLSFLNPLVNAFGGAWDWVKGKLSGITDALSGIGDTLSTLFTQETLSPAQVTQITDRARQVTEGIINWFKQLPGRILEMAGQLVEAGKQLIQSIWDGAVARFAEFIEWVKGIPGRIVEAIGNIDLSNIIEWPSMPAWMGGSGAVTAAENPAGEFAGVDGTRAGGGPVSRGGTYLVGEEGPELITPTANGFVQTTDETQRMLRPDPEGLARSQQRTAGGNPSPAPASMQPKAQPQPITATVNLGGINIHAAPGMSPQEVAAAVRREIETATREFFRGVYADTGMRFT